MPNDIRFSWLTDGEYLVDRVLTRFKVLTFDVVGTLIDFEAGLTGGLEAIAAEHGVPVDGEAALAIYRDCRRDPEAGKFPDDVARCYEIIADKTGLPRGAEYGARMVEAVAAAPAFPDSVEALARLGRRFRLVAMTNAQRWAFERFGAELGNPFHKGFTTDDTGTEKPDPAFFEFVLADLGSEGVAKADILHVAQSQYHDIGISRQLGLTNCWIERRHGRSGYGGTIAPESFTEPDFHFTSLAALADAVEAQ
ncbi:HAD-IA family hydrolase [Aurantimonas sp. VKM B-3413]|uniref:HAD-IA family hydrolase n=1 Tax=Aurantimonas sp. VKM B-3413 TaxID=2779401 RepID=UPI001E3EDA27|nr:HAD-IA family hydrolase [Aurantimonas sp. VKM B-3413]MCB8840352.1 HAD-IA family hydrolase [Aurantimonas sp. VKM B-3413]